MNPTRRAMTMMEVMISLTLFSVVMVAVIQSMISATTYVEFDSSRTDLQTESLQFQSRAINDFANAAWFFRYDPGFDKSYINPMTQAREPLYPAVSAARDTIEFIKLRSSLAVANAPAAERYSFTNFRSGSAPVDFSHYVDAVPTALMVMNPDYRADPQWFVASAWESSRVGLTFDENQDPELLRHYLYAVEADASGTRNLVRKFLNGYSGTPPMVSAWTFDEILIRDVSTVQFFTHFEDPALNENQIRISVSLQRKPQGSAGTGVTVKRQLEITAAMRSINQEN